jgi:carbon monoxide dehydrogenase subunit G
MEFGGRYLFATPRAHVWQALNDTEILRAAIPGCQRIAWVGPAALEVEVKVNLGLVHPVLGGDLELTGIVPAERYTLNGRGRGGLLGLAHAAADIDLTDAGEGTELSFRAQGHADGPVMKFGKALIGDRAQGLIDGFFERIGAAMGTTVNPLGPETLSAEADSPAGT